MFLAIFEIAKNGIFPKKNCEIDLFDFTSFLAWTFLSFLAHCGTIEISSKIAIFFKNDEKPFIQFELPSFLGPIFGYSSIPLLLTIKDVLSMSKMSMNLKFNFQSFLNNLNILVLI